MTGFVEQKVQTLRGMTASSISILWVCAILFLSPGLSLTKMLITDWITQPEVLDGNAFILVGVILSIGLLITFFAIKRSRQRARLISNPYTFVTVFGSDESAEDLSLAFNTECQQKLDFEYANYMYVTNSHILAVEGLGIHIAKIPSIVWVYYEESITPDVVATQGKTYAANANTAFLFHLFFKNSNKPMVLSARKREDVSLLARKLQGYGLTVETDTNMYKLASRDYDLFIKECKAKNE